MQNCEQPRGDASASTSSERAPNAESGSPAEALHTENQRLRQEKAELLKRHKEEIARTKGALDQAEQEILISQEQDRLRDLERARAKAAFDAEYASLENRTCILKIEKERLQWRVNEQVFRRDQQRFRREE